MKNNTSQVKDNNQSNFSSVPTVTYSSSPVSSPLKDKNFFNKERLISEPKYSNENIFEKKASKAINNIYQSNVIKPRNNGIYITGLANSSEMPSDIQRSMTTNENSNISKSISNREKKPKVHKKLNLPYIITNISPNEDLIPISPVFSCCDEENSPRLLNKILYRQQIQEQKNNKCKTSGNENKIVNSKPKKVAVKDGPKNYISKTREINRLKYCINLKLENIKDFYYDYRQEIKNIDFTINSIKAYKNNLEHKFINEYVSQLRSLNKITLNERLKEEQQRNEIVRLKKSISNMSYRKKRLELNKFLIEKWIGLQVYIKDKIRMDGKQIKNYITKGNRRQSLFQSADEFEDFFKKKEINNLRLIQTLNVKTQEKAVLFKELKNVELYNIEDDNYLIKMITEKEKLLKLLKRRNSELLQERNEVKKMNSEPKFDKLSPINLDLISFTPKKDKNTNKEKDKENSNKNIIINYNIIYPLIQKTFDYIIANDKSSLSESEDTFRYINSINIPSTKALSQMKMIEMAYTYLIYYKMNNMEGNETLYKQLMEEIEHNHKKRKAEKYKKEEELKEYEMHKKMEEKKNRIVFKSRKDDYSSLIYIEKIKNKERKMKKNTKKKLDIFDFLYDIDEDKIN
jgi:hypothetical protein